MHLNAISAFALGRHTYKNFPDNQTNSCMVIASIFFQNRYFPKRKTKLKKFIRLLKQSLNSFEMKKE